MTAIYEVRILKDYGEFLLGISENENIDQAKKVFEKAVKVLLMCDVSKEPYESEYIAVVGRISTITV